MKPSELMSLCWNRVAFALSLAIDSETMLNEGVPLGDAGGFGVRFQYDDSADWVHLSLSPWEADHCPRLEIVLTLLEDLSNRSLLANYELANALNLRGFCCATSYESKTGTMQIRSNIVYSGYSDNPDIDHNSNFEQSEATVNWMLQTLSLGREALRELASSPVS